MSRQGPRKKKRVKGRVKVKKRDVAPDANNVVSDSTRRAPTTIPSNGPAMKIKIKRKGK